MIWNKMGHIHIFGQLPSYQHTWSLGSPDDGGDGRHLEDVSLLLGLSLHLAQVVLVLVLGPALEMISSRHLQKMLCLCR